MLPHELHNFIYILSICNVLEGPVAVPVMGWGGLITHPDFEASAHQISTFKADCELDKRPIAPVYWIRMCKRPLNVMLYLFFLITDELLTCLFAQFVVQKSQI